MRVIGFMIANRATHTYTAKIDLDILACLPRHKTCAALTTRIDPESIERDDTTTDNACNLRNA